MTELSSISKNSVNNNRLVSVNTSDLFFIPAIQPKLTINQPNDIYEQEADAMADKVMRTPHPSIDDNLFFRPSVSAIQRKCSHCEEEERQMQRKEKSEERGAASGELEEYVETLSGSGSSLSPQVRGFFEPRMGYELSKVKVHTDEAAARSAASINALAYTTGNNIVFNQGQYSPDTDSGKRLLGHELTHVVQQNSGVQTKTIQRTYELSHLYWNGAATRPNPINTNPVISFYPGSTANTTNRKALIIAGIHGEERSAHALGNEIKNQLDSGTSHTDFHTILVPDLSPSSSRAAGSGPTLVPDLNREFGRPGGNISPNPLANTVTQIVNEFDPERVMSIHAISTPSLGGVFLDPVNAGTYPATGAGSVNANAFAGDPRNMDAMLLADSMIAAISNTSSTPGNVPTTARPASIYPGTGAGSSPSSLIYPLQGGISTTGPTSLGVWVSTLGKPIYTIEIPGYTAAAAVWQSFLPAIWEFLRIPRTSSSTPTPGTSNQPTGWIRRIVDSLHNLFDRLSGIPAPLPREPRPTGLDPSCLTFNNRTDLETRKTHWAGVIAGIPLADVVNWVIGISLPGAARTAMAESLNQKNCMLQALSISAGTGTSGSPIQNAGTPSWSSGRRDFAGQSAIWHEKFAFTRGTPFDRISDNAKTICGSLLISSETKWNTRNERHRRCWGVPPLNASAAPAIPVGARSLTDDEKQMEILQASSAPGISRHHWGTDFDIFSDEPTEWTTAGAGRNFLDEYSWLLGNASMYGFIQAFTPLSAYRQLGYMEERWHWSYWPVAQALLEFVGTHDSDVQAVLTSQWGTSTEFSFISSHWREFMNNVNQTPTP